MKLQNISIVILLLSLQMNGQALFKIVESPRNHIDINEQAGKTAHKYYRIKLAKGKVNISYPIILPEQGFDTLKAIGELLSYEGDTRLCSLPIANYNSLRSQIYMGLAKNYSIQVEALFLITQLVLKKPFNYASYPVLIDDRTKQDASISGVVIKKAFQAYKDWYAKIKKVGISRFDFEKRLPLNDSSIRWY